MEIEKFKDYLNENSLESDIEWGTYKEKDQEIEKNPHEIKLNTLELADFYLKFYNEFKRLFKDFKPAKDIIESNFKIAHELIILKNEMKREIIFGSSRRKRNLEKFVTNNYEIICDFFDLAWGIFI